MKILLVSKSNQQPCRQALTWNQHSSLFWPEIAVLDQRRCVKMKILLVFKSNQQRCLQAWTWNHYFDLKSRFFSELTHCVKWRFCSFLLKSNQQPCRQALTWNQHSNLGFWAYALREMKILLVFKSNQQPSRKALMWNQDSNLFWPEFEVFELTRCVKWRICSFLSQINSLAVRP